MDAGEKIMKALAPGEGVKTEEDVTLTFLGREWHVQAFIGSQHNGGALIIHPEIKEIDPAIVARMFMMAACVCMCGATGTPDHRTLDRLAQMLGESFANTAHQLAAYRAARGKPS